MQFEVEGCQITDEYPPYVSLLSIPKSMPMLDVLNGSYGPVCKYNKNTYAYDGTSLWGFWQDVLRIEGQAWRTINTTLNIKDDALCKHLIANHFSTPDIEGQDWI